MGEGGTVHCERQDGGVAVLTMDHQERRNALSLHLREVLHDALAELVADDAVRAVVLTGAGGCFSAGGDVSGMAGLTGLAGRRRVARLHRLVRLLIAGETPVVAAVEGYAVGAGMSLAAACDVVVSARDARWSCAFNRIGLMPDMAALWVLPQRMGLGRARMAMLTGDTFDGAEAAAQGLVEVVTEPGAARDEAVRIAGRIAAGAPAAHGFTKAMLARLPQGLDEALRAEADAQALLFTSEDFAEGRAAFAEKRTPAFKGR